MVYIDKKKEYAKAYRLKNREKINKEKKEYRIKNKEQIKKRTKEYYRKNKSRMNRASNKQRLINIGRTKEYQLLKNYGIDMKEYLFLKDKQNSLCAICKKKCNSGRELSVDHCHKTGKVRGLLCVKCNAGIGMLNEDIKIFERVIRYLKK